MGEVNPHGRFTLHTFRLHIDDIVILTSSRVTQENLHQLMAWEVRDYI